MTAKTLDPQPTLFGHPTGLFTLFFAEMWERFSYYGMRALLVFYMIKGFLSYDDKQAYAVYGAYTMLVYATPFIGGMLADHLLGARRAVVLGGLLMAAGHLLMTIEESTAFFVALALLIVGNGFFKPNISTIVGKLYPEGSVKRDGGFTLFYMGINLGAAMSPLLCGYIGETYGWHYGFGLATIGMLIGLAVFVAPVRITQVLILLGALASAVGLVAIPDSPYLIAVNAFVAAALVIAGGVAFVALGRGGLPDHLGRPPKGDRLKQPAWAGIAKSMPWLTAGRAVLIGTVVSVPLLALLVQKNAIAYGVLIVFGVIALGSLVFEAVRANKVERERLWVVLILMFFSMLFWAFFEQAGSSVNNFTDRNVDRVNETRVITQEDVGQTLNIEVTQEQLGYTMGERLVTLDVLDKMKKDAAERAKPGEKVVVTAAWPVSEDDVGMGVAEAGDEVPATVFQAANPIFIILFGLVFTALWSFLGARGLEPSTPVKFSIGLLLLGLGFGAFWYGASAASDTGMVWLGWLLLGYLLQTTGELCLSPVGLSMVTKLSPKRIVSTVMGAWFLATAFSNGLAAVIASFTGVSGHGGEEGAIPPPIDTVDVYGEVFYTIALLAMGAAVLLFALSPLLTKWMHEDVKAEELEEASA